jgi:hypothetical protein
MNVEYWLIAIELLFSLLSSYTPTPPPAHNNQYTSSVQPMHYPPTIWPFVAPVPVHHHHHHHATTHRHSMPFAGMPYYASTHVPVVPMVGGGGDMSTNAHLADVARNDVSWNACFLLFRLFLIRFRNAETIMIIRVPYLECAK